MNVELKYAKQAILVFECSLFYAKIVPKSAEKTCFQSAECSLSYAKILFFYFILKIFIIKVVFVVIFIIIK